MSFFSSLFKKQASVLGVDIGSSSVKIVQIRKKRGRVVLQTYGELALGPYGNAEIGQAVALSPEKLTEAVKDIVREAKTTTTICGTALPLSASLIAFITIPAVEEARIGEVVSLEARKYIPVPLSEVLLDYSIIPKDEPFTPTDDKAKVESQNIEVLVVAIHNDYITEYQSVMAGSALQPGFYEIEIFSSIRALLDGQSGTSMIFDMGARTTKLYIVERGQLRSSHIVGKGSQDITIALSKTLSISIAEAESLKRSHGLKGGPEYRELDEIITVNLDYVFYETNSAITAYQKKYGRNVSRIILTGGGVLLKGFVDLAKLSFQTEVLYADPFAKLETPAILAEEFAKAGPAFAVSIGAALRRLAEME